MTKHIAPEKPVWESPERNKTPILKVLEKHVTDCTNVLEVGSGTGQHAVFFAKQLSHLQWQCTDQAEYITGITQWITEANLPNLQTPITFDVNTTLPNFRSQHNSTATFDIVYTANTLHIMSWDSVINFFACLSHLTTKKSLLIIYGPFNYDGHFTSESNASFDARLKEKDSNMGIRDRADIVMLAEKVGFRLLDDYAMPAHNRCIVFTQSPLN